MWCWCATRFSRKRDGDNNVHHMYICTSLIKMIHKITKTTNSLRKSAKILENLLPFIIMSSSRPILTQTRPTMYMGSIHSNIMRMIESESKWRMTWVRKKRSNRINVYTRRLAIQCCYHLFSTVYIIWNQTDYPWTSRFIFFFVHIMIRLLVI